jgi:hypothetical protein
MVRRSPVLVLGVLTLVITCIVPVKKASADCDPNTSDEGCLYYAPIGLTGHIASIVGGSNPGVDIDLHWSYSIPANSPSAPDSIVIYRGIGLLANPAWQTSGAYTDHVTPYPTGSPLIYKVCSWYNSVGYYQNVCASTAVSVPTLPSSPPPGTGSSGGAPGGTGCALVVSPTAIAGDPIVQLIQFSSIGYTATVTLGFAKYDKPGQPCYAATSAIRVRRYADGAANANFSLELDPTSWAPDGPHPAPSLPGTYYLGPFNDPIDPRTYQNPNSPSLREGVTYRYELCAENAVGITCLGGSILTPAAPPDPPSFVSVCALQGARGCSSVSSFPSSGRSSVSPGHSSGPFKATSGFIALPPFGEFGAGPVAPPSRLSGGSVIFPRLGGTPPPTTFADYLQISWSPADQRTTRIDVQRHDLGTPIGNWTTVASGAGSTTSATVLAGPSTLSSYRVCFRGEAYNNPAIPVGAALQAQLANACSLSVSTLTQLSASPGGVHVLPPPVLPFQ